VLESPAFSAGDRSLAGIPQCSLWQLRLLVAVLPFVLRRLVYRRGFWEKGLGLAAGEAVSQRLVTDYRWPSLVEDWDRGLALFVASRIYGVPEETGLADKLKDACKDGLRVVVVSGDDDRIVPASSSKALSEAIGANLVSLRGGHTLHEEDPAVFAKAVAPFLRKTGR